jgi:hypothetical protein
MQASFMNTKKSPFCCALLIVVLVTLFSSGIAAAQSIPSFSMRLGPMENYFQTKIYRVKNL